MLKIAWLAIIHWLHFQKKNIWDNVFLHIKYMVNAIKCEDKEIFTQGLTEFNFLCSFGRDIYSIIAVNQFGLNFQQGSR